MRTVIGKKIRRFASYADIPKIYRDLCGLYLPRPIHDVRENQAATEMMHALVVFSWLHREQQDYLDAITDFVNAYDRTQQIGWPKTSPL
jgi:hypothetical protein